MPFSPELLEMLACPKCRGEVKLTADERGFVCASCRLVYPVIDEIPALVERLSHGIRDDARRLGFQQVMLEAIRKL